MGHQAGCIRYQISTDRVCPCPRSQECSGTINSVQGTFDSRFRLVRLHRGNCSNGQFIWLAFVDVQPELASLDLLKQRLGVVLHLVLDMGSSCCTGPFIIWLSESTLTK
jgi:hypothetical protein